jgi:hypothetical protein
LAAIGLLYLDESEAFWFVVACVEHLQPLDYYTSSLAGAVTDQRVLLDLVQVNYHCMSVIIIYTNKSEAFWFISILTVI